MSTVFTFFSFSLFSLQLLPHPFILSQINVVLLFNCYYYIFICAYIWYICKFIKTKNKPIACWDALVLSYVCVLRSGLLGLDNLSVRGLCLEKNDCPLSAASAVLPHIRFQERWTVDYALLESSVVYLSLMHSWPLFCWQMYFSVCRDKVVARPWASAEMEKNGLHWWQPSPPLCRGR